MNLKENLKNKNFYFIIIGILILISVLGYAIYSNYYLVNKMKDHTKNVSLSHAVMNDTVNDVKLQAIKEMEDRIPRFSNSSIQKLDLTLPSGVNEKDLGRILKGGLKGLEKDFIAAEKKYNVNAVFLVSIAAIESAWGTINFFPNNMFGYGRSGFPSKSACIDTVAKGLGTRYLKPGGGLYSGKTLSAVNKRYASSSKWDDKVGNTMVKLYNQMYENNKKDILNYSK